MRPVARETERPYTALEPSTLQSPLNLPASCCRWHPSRPESPPDTVLIVPLPIAPRHLRDAFRAAFAFLAHAVPDPAWKGRTTPHSAATTTNFPTATVRMNPP